MIDLNQYLRDTAYPGRGIALGRSADDQKAVIAYFIMGRSENSRNRVFEATGDGIRTRAFDESKMTDPSLIIYHPVRTAGRNTIVTNGDQTDTIRDFLLQGKTFRDALMTRTFEPDGPNWTPRISGLVRPDGSYSLSILKSRNGDPACCCRYFYEYDAPKAGVGHFISTYRDDGTPLPSFEGEPLPFSVAAPDAGTWANQLWESLNPRNRVSLFVQYIDLATGRTDTALINRWDREQRGPSLELKYGCNPNQKPARIFMRDGSPLPVTVLNGRPGYINFLDAFNAWQLVKELKEALGRPAAASFKHVSPTSAAVGLQMSNPLKKACFVDDIPGLDQSPLARAYAMARGTDRLCSFGDWAALSDVCDETTARVLQREVSDGVIAPGYTDEALEILKSKRRGGYNIVQIDPDYVPAPIETKDVYGVTFEQGRNNFKIGPHLLENIVTENKTLIEPAKRDLIVALITLKYTQSNSVCFAFNGQAIGVGAGQQSRIHCTRLAGSKADTWLLRQHPMVLDLPFLPTLGRPERDNVIDGYINGNEEDVCADGIWQRYFTCQPDRLTPDIAREWLDGFQDVSLASDAFFPFPDNIERARRSGVRYVAQPGGSIRDDLVIQRCNDYGMLMAFTGMRLFHH